jgi:RNA polymerase sigma factor (sigma-70 family)
MRESELERLTDGELAGSACNGDERAFEDILHRYGPRVFRIAGHFFREQDKVEDIVQEVFLKAFLRLSRFEGRGSLEGWLSKISTTVCLNAIRHSKSRPEVQLGMPTEEEGAWLEARLARRNNGRNVSAEQSILEADLAEKVLDNARTQLQEIHRELQPRIDALRRQTSEKLQAVLTPEQWQQFRKMVSSAIATTTISTKASTN